MRSNRLAAPRTFVCVASGPSLHADDVEYCRGRATVLVVNNNFAIAPWADALYASDHGWWYSYIKRVRATFGGECWTRDETAAEALGLLYVRSTRAPGLGVEPGTIHEGENSGYQAINLAYQLGATKIVLTGYDMRGRGHWHEPHPAPLVSTDDFGQFARHFDRLASDLRDRGVQVINATRNTGLRCFERATIQEALA